ncbi:hypothetical protein N7494_004391 [Penicillium frequentans]|uniref:Uncharacterized protein n=1 Tax=Penicillium frequentans TaxID=3151616 RepID=A0AAD6D2M5_9EURO|nr:hypothetical protein N7494_004391 [Penicillium glabrum]
MLLNDEVGGPARQGWDTSLYEYWLDCLMQEFNLRMYNEFRRQALDDLFTRHTDDGFNFLMEYYRLAVGSPFRIHPRILSDLVGLCRDEAFKPRDAIFSLIETAVANDQGNEKFHKIDFIRKQFTRAFGNQWRGTGRKSYH